MRCQAFSPVSSLTLVQLPRQRRKSTGTRTRTTRPAPEIPTSPAVQPRQHLRPQFTRLKRPLRQCKSRPSPGSQTTRNPRLTATRAMTSSVQHPATQVRHPTVPRTPGKATAVTVMRTTGSRAPIPGLNLGPGSLSVCSWSSFVVGVGWVSGLASLAARQAALIVSTRRVTIPFILPDTLP